MASYEDIGTRCEHSTRKYKINKVTVFLPHCYDARTIKRMRQFMNRGFNVFGFSFRRKMYNDDYIPEWDNISLGNIEHEKYIRRLIPIFRAILVIIKARKRLRGTAIFYANKLDPALLAIFARKISRSTSPVIYEVSDIYIPFVQRNFIGYFFRFLEKIALYNIDLLVVTSIGFIKHYYGPIQNYKKEWFLLENKIYPPLSSFQDKEYSLKDQKSIGQEKSNNKWIIGYSGVLRCVKSWEMIKFLAQEIPEKVEFYLSGVLDSINQEDFYKTLRDFQNITYSGEYLYPDDLLKIYSSIHFSWCIDLSQSWYNSKWLMPNRFYESGLFSVPMIALKGFEVGNYIDYFEIGWTISEPYLENLIDFLSELTWVEYISKKQKLNSLQKSYFQGDDEFKEMCNVIMEKTSLKKNIEKIEI